MILSDRLTSAFISAKDATTEDLAFRINGGADFLCICTRTHSIHMHLILGGHCLQKVLPTGSGWLLAIRRPGIAWDTYRGLM